MSHEQIWAPWRLTYITKTHAEKIASAEQAAGTPAAGPACFLCDYAKAAGRDAENLVIARGNSTLTVLNRYPYNNGHLLVAPLAHKPQLTDLNDDELLECMQELQQTIRLLDRALTPQGYNVGLNLGHVAGAGLPGHLHWHLVPRWSGDTNFMPVMAGVNVIPQSLEALYSWLKEN